MSETTINILVAVIGFPLFGIGFYLWAKAFRHMIGTMSNFKQNMSWGRFVPICIFMPVFFTEQGNLHREQLLKYSGLFIVYCGLPFLIYGLWKLFSS